MPSSATLASLWNLSAMLDLDLTGVPHVAIDHVRETIIMNDFANYDALGK